MVKCSGANFFIYKLPHMMIIGVGSLFGSDVGALLVLLCLPTHTTHA